MKKLTLLFTCLLASLYFFTCFFAQGDANYRNSQDANKPFNNSEYKNSPSINLSLKASLGEDEEAIATLLQILESGDHFATGSLGSMGDAQSRSIDFVYSKKDLYKNQFYTVDNERIDFSNPNEKRYYSLTNVPKKNKITIDLLNPMYYRHTEVYQMELHPLYQMKKGLSPTGMVISNFTAQQFTSRIENTPLEKYINDVNDVQFDYDIINVREAKGIQYDSNGILIICLILALVTLSLLLMVNIVKNKKMVAISRLHGISKLRILFHVFLPFISKIIIAYSLTQLLLLYSIAGPYRLVTRDLYQTIILSIIGFAIILILLLLIVYCYLTLYRNFHELKQNKINRFTIYANIIIKLVMSIVLIAPFVQLVPDAYTQLQRTLALQKLSKQSENRYSYDVMNSMDNLTDFNMEEKRMAVSTYLSENHNAITFNFMQWYLENNEGIELYDLTMKIPPVVSVNKEYLKRYGNIYKENGDLLKLEDLSNVLLVPKQYKKDAIVEEYAARYETKEVIDIQNFKKEFTPILISEIPYKPYLQNPIVCIVDEYDSNFNSSTTYIDTTDLKGVYEELANIGYGDNVTFNSIYPAITLEYNQQFNTLVTMAFLLIGYLIVYLAFVYQNIYVYLDVYRKNIMVKYLNGYSYLRRYYEIYAINLCAYIIAGILCFAIFQINPIAIVSYIAFFSSIEIIFELWQIRQFEKREALASLK